MVWRKMLWFMDWLWHRNHFRLGQFVPHVFKLDVRCFFLDSHGAPHTHSHIMSFLHIHIWHPSTDSCGVSHNVTLHTWCGSTHANMSLSTHKHGVSLHTHSATLHTHTWCSSTHTVPLYSPIMSFYTHMVSLHTHTHGAALHEQCAAITYMAYLHMHTQCIYTHTCTHTHSVSLSAHRHGVPSHKHYGVPLHTHIWCSSVHTHVSLHTHTCTHTQYVSLYTHT